MKTQQPKMKIDANGTKQWFLNDQRHRTDGPAIEWASGAKSWWLNGKCHRTDGPAVEWANGNKRWYLKDKHLGNDEAGFQALLQHLGDTDPVAAYNLLLKHPEYHR